MKRTNEFEKFKIIKKSTNKAVLNVYLDSFGIEKVRFQLANYETKEKIDCYLEFSEVLLLAEQSVTGQLFKQMPRTIHMGGKNHSEEYNGPLSRTMSLGMMGDKLFVNMQQGEGKLSETGLIIPNGQPKVKLGVGMSVQDFQEVLVTCKAYIQAYLPQMVIKLVKESHEQRIEANK